MSRRSLLFLATAAAAGAAGIGAALWRYRTTAPTGDLEQVWQLRFDKPEGGELALADFRGKPLLLNFWATWCPPCITEMPLLDQFEKAQAPRGWQVLGLAIDQRAAVSEFLRQRPVGFAIGMAGPDGVALSRQLGNPSGGLPFSVVFDRQGRIARTKLGSIDEKLLADWVAALG